MIWRPSKTLGLLVGLIFFLTALGIQVFLVRTMIGQPIGLNLYFTALAFLVTIPLILTWGYWYYALVSLRYYLDRNGLIISCGMRRYVVPMEAISGIVPGGEAEVSQGFRGVGWPGFLMGRMQLVGLGNMLVFSTEPLDHQLVFVTDAQCYGLSVSNKEAFLHDFEARRALEPIRKLTQNAIATSLASLPIWSDRWFLAGIAAAGLACLVLFGVLAGIWGRLPERVPIHLGFEGNVDQIAAKINLFIFPVIAAVAFVINALIAVFMHRRERLVAHLLIVVSLVVDLVVWLALLGIVGR